MPIRLTTSRQLACFLVTVVLTSLAAHAQGQFPTPDSERYRMEREDPQRAFDRRMREIRNLNREPSDLRYSRVYSRPVKLSAEQKKLLEPSEAHKAAFAAFLRQPDTGLVRLLPREKYDRSTAMPLRGGGAFYSFTKTSHDLSLFSDIMFQNGQFRTGIFSLNQGLMTTQGETPLEQLTADNKAFIFLYRLVVPLDYHDFVIQSDKNKAGFEVEGNLY
jgi:hypothetical protein